MKQHTLWIEKYRSETLEQYIGNDAIKARIADCIASNDIPHFIFAGSAGTGKTTLAKLIVKNIQCDYLYINASDENGIDIIRDKVKGFASTSTFKPLKVVILDESDFLTQPAQAALRNLIEEYSMVTRFVLTCNYIERLIEPLQSRCETHLLTPPSKGNVAKHVCTSILDVEGVQYEMSDVATIIKEYYPDVKSLMIEANADHINDLIRIGPYITALIGKNNEEVDYYVCDDKNNDQGNGIYKENTNVPFKSTKRKTITLDSLLYGQKFDLIKMDVQGAELDIIQGSPGFIHDTKYLWLELQPHNYNIGAPLAGKVIGYLNQIGFEMIVIDEISEGDGVIISMDVIFVNVRNKDLKTGYDITKKVIWSGYSQ